MLHNVAQRGRRPNIVKHNSRTVQLELASQTTTMHVSTPMVALSRNIPRKQAFEMLTTGQFIDADRAMSLGLVNRVVAHDELGTETRALADTVAAKLAVAVKIGKEAFYNQLQMPVEAAYTYAGDVMVTNMLHRDTEEGISAFLEKRPPEWD